MIGYTKLLESILERANSIKDNSGDKILTVNHFFAAALEFCKRFSIDKDSFEEFDRSEVLALRSLLQDVDFSDGVSSYVQLLCERKGTYLDDLAFKNVLKSAEQDCRKKGNENISADDFMRNLFFYPTVEIKKIMNIGKANEPKPETDKKEEETTQDFIKMFDELFADYDSKKKKRESSENVKQEKSPESTVTPKERVADLTKKVKEMHRQLSNRIFGQDNAIDIFVSGYFHGEMKSITDKSNKRPKATYLFAGPPGVGKTYLAEQAAEQLGLPFKRFDMSEYSERDAVMELCGTNKSYKGDKEGGLTSFVNENPECVLLFDEIEKAHIVAIHLFLQVLDAGRLRDINSGKEIDFSKTIIIFTTNAGRKIYEDSAITNLSGVSRKVILKTLETDVDPLTGKSSFPAAICSRFATGNVVMFNHMEAHTLRKIAEKEIVRSAKAFEEETGIRCNISEDVYSCVLFSEGGQADARTVKSRAGSFFGTELYELFRLASGEKGKVDIKDIERINVSVEIPDDEEVKKLFRDDTKGSIMVFGRDFLCEKINAVTMQKGYENIVVTSVEEAKMALINNDIEIVFCDLYSENRGGKSNVLNIEDVKSGGRSFFRYICGETDVPLYIVSDGEHTYSEEEKFSLTKEGARDIVDFSDEEKMKSVTESILARLHQQQSMTNLAKSKKIIKYETAQVLSEDKKTADIKIFDVVLETAVEAEDEKNILNNVSKQNVKFDDIIGAEDAKKELEFFIKYLKNPKEYIAKGLGAPKGVLFYGPPGTGKTMLAKATAGESDVSFISAEGNEFLQRYVGEGERKVHELFATARKYAPSIIFIDEVDAISKERTGGDNSHHESVLTAFLAEMDGFKTDATKPVFVMAATNFEVEKGSAKSLDEAFLRRFDRLIYIDLPDKEARIRYIKMKIKNKPVFRISDGEIENIAVRSTGMSLAKLESVFEFAMRLAVRTEKFEVTDEIFEEAFETFVYGEERKWDASELKKTAYHEAGHAFLCWYGGETPSYVTIVARGNHGGYMLHGDTEKRGSYTKQMLLDRIRTSLGGRAAELVFYGDEDGLTTGASGDLASATNIAKRIICSYGMDEKAGLAVISETEAVSGYMAQQIRESVNGILNEELENAKSILRENREAVDKMVEALLEKDHLGAKEIDRIFSAFAKKRTK